MTEALTKHHKNLSAMIHASTFVKYVIPFGNFILPLVLWTANRTSHPFIDRNGKQAINFQISLLLYSICIGALTLPFLLFFFADVFHFGLLNIINFNELDGVDLKVMFNSLTIGKLVWPLLLAGLAQTGLFVLNVVYTILATLRASEGIYFKYPLTINFMK